LPAREAPVDRAAEGLDAALERGDLLGEVHGAVLGLEGAELAQLVLEVDERLLEVEEVSHGEGKGGGAEGGGSAELPLTPRPPPLRAHQRPEEDLNVEQERLVAGVEPVGAVGLDDGGG